MPKKKSEKKKKRYEPKERKDLTVRQSRFAKILSQRVVKSRGEAAVLAGYSPKNAHQSAAQALEAIRNKAPEVMAELGLDLKSVIKNHLQPLLYATETKVFAHEGEITDYVDLEDNTTRRYATHTALELLGAFPSEEEKHNMNVGVEVVVLDVVRPDRSAINVTPTTGKVPSKISPKVADNGAKADKPDPRPKD